MDNEDRTAQIEELLNEIRQRRENAASELQLDTYITAEIDAIKSEPDKKGEPREPERKKLRAYEEPKTAPRNTATFDKRSVLQSLFDDDSRASADPINKSALAPSIEKETARLKRDNSTLLEQEIDEAADWTVYAEKHSIFTDDAFASTDLFATAELPAANAKEPSAGNADTVAYSVEAAALRVEKKGVLNVRDNIDDNFREFFGSTVLIDKESLDDKTKKQRKVKDFVFTDSSAGIKGGPVFEDEETEEEEPAPSPKQEKDAAKIHELLLEQRGRSLFGTVFSGIFALLLCALCLLARAGTLPALLQGPALYYVICIALYATALGFNMRSILSGFSSLVTLTPDGSSLIAFGSAAALLELLVLVFSPPEPRAVSACVMGASLFLMSAGIAMEDNRVLRGFEQINTDEDKFATLVLDDQAFTRKITKNLGLGQPHVIIKRRTGQVENYLDHAEGFDKTPKSVSIAALAGAALSLVFGIISLLSGGGLSGALFSASLFAALVSPFTSTIASALPIGRVSGFLSKLGSVVAGYGAVDELSQANCVVLTGRELFPKGNVLLHGIKTFERERVDKAILYAASVLVQSCDTMVNMFLNVIQNKTEMLYQVEGVEYESDRGFSFWVGKDRILLGTREHLESHDIDVPTRDYENRYTKTSTRDAIYLAVGGRLYAMFVISYAPNEDVKDELKKLCADGLNIVVHTRDFNLSPAKIAKLYGIPKNMIEVVRDDDVPELSRRTGYTPKTNSSLTHMGSMASFIAGVTACRKLDGMVKLSMNLELVSMALGALLGAVLLLFAKSAEVNVMAVMLFQLVWLAVSAIGTYLKSL